MNSRRQVLVAAVAVALLLVILLSLHFKSDAGNEGVSNALPESRAPATTGPAPKQVVVPDHEKDPEAASGANQVEQAPATAGPDPATFAGSASLAGAVTPVVATSVERTSDPGTNTRRLNIEAECWGLRGSAPRDYVVTLDREVRTSGDSSALIASRRSTSGYTTMFQTSSAAPVKGRRVEFSADVRTRGAKGSANLLLRAEDAYGNTVAFDNMATSYEAARRPDRLVNRGVMGDSEWSTQHVVVDIPAEAAVITYGMSLFGEGQAWIDNARIEVVTEDMATTAIDVRQSPTPPNGIPVNPAALQRSPRNLEFEFEAQAGAAPCN